MKDGDFQQLCLITRGYISVCHHHRPAQAPKKGAKMSEEEAKVNGPKLSDDLHRQVDRIWIFGSPLPIDYGYNINDAHQKMIFGH